MASDTPLPDRCGAPVKGGGFCDRKPQDGNIRCKQHLGRTLTFTERMRHLADDAREELDAAIADPGLMDVRRPLALAETVITRSPVVPSEDLVYRTAQRRIASQCGQELYGAIRQFVADGGDMEDASALREVVDEVLAVTDADLDEARMELHRKSMSLLESYSKRQVEAVRQLEWSKAMREAAIPFLQELGMQFSMVLRRHVPDDRLASAVEETRRAVMVTIGRLSGLQPKAGK